MLVEEAEVALPALVVLFPEADELAVELGTSVMVSTIVDVPVVRTLPDPSEVNAESVVERCTDALVEVED